MRYLYLSIYLSILPSEKDPSTYIFHVGDICIYISIYLSILPNEKSPTTYLVYVGDMKKSRYLYNLEETAHYNF